MKNIDERKGSRGKTGQQEKIWQEKTEERRTKKNINEDIDKRGEESRVEERTPKTRPRQLDDKRVKNIILQQR